MSRITITIETAPDDPKQTIVKMEADPPFCPGQELTTHTLGVAAMARIQQKAEQSSLAMKSSFIRKADGTEVDDTEWTRDLIARHLCRPWWRFWR